MKYTHDEPLTESLNDDKPRSLAMTKSHFFDKNLLKNEIFISNKILASSNGIFAVKLCFFIRFFLRCFVYFRMVFAIKDIKK